MNHSSDLFLCHLKGTGRASANEAGKFRTWSEFETGHRLLAPVEQKRRAEISCHAASSSRNPPVRQRWIAASFALSGPRPTTSSADRYGLPSTARIHDRRGCVLVGDGIEPADHCGGRIGLASSTLASGDRLPQRMSGWRQLKGVEVRLGRRTEAHGTRPKVIGPVAIDENSLCQSYHLHRQLPSTPPKAVQSDLR